MHCPETSLATNFYTFSAEPTLALQMSSLLLICFSEKFEAVNRVDSGQQPGLLVTGSTGCLEQS